MASLQTQDPPTLTPAEAAPQHGPVAPVITLWLIMTLFVASSAILTRFCKISPSAIGFWRVFGAGTALLPWFIQAARRQRPKPLINRGAVLTGVIFGVHFATWAWALLHSHLANAALVIAMQPAVTPILGHWATGDRLSRREWIGTGLGCLGMLWTLGGQIAFTPDQIPGSLVALFSMVCCAVYLVLSRKYRTGQHVTLFSVPVYLAATATQAIPALFSTMHYDQPFLPPTRSAGLALLALIIVPTLGGHTLAMYLVRHTKAHTVALSIPVQFILITLAAMALFHEWPPTWFYPGAGLVIIGVLLAILKPAK